MKKISIILLLMFGTFSMSIAQTTPAKAKTTVSKQDKAAIAAHKKADKDAKALAKMQAKQATLSSSTQTAAAQKKADKEAKTMAKAQAKAAKASASNQAAATQTSAAQAKADKEAKALAKKQAKDAKVAAASNTAGAHLNKNGTPDKRFKTNQQPKATTHVTPQVQPTQSMQARTVTTPAKVTRSTVARTSTVKTADKVISTDAKGRTIYLGPRGGKYYIDKNGNKEYVK